MTECHHRLPEPENLSWSARWASIAIREQLVEIQRGIEALVSLRLDVTSMGANHQSSLLLEKTQRSSRVISLLVLGMFIVNNLQTSSQMQAKIAPTKLASSVQAVPAFLPVLSLTTSSRVTASM